MLGLRKFRTATLCQNIQLKVSADDYVIRNEVKNLNDAADNRHRSAHPRNDCASCVDAHRLRLQIGVSGFVHHPYLAAASILSFSCASVYYQILEQSDAGVVRCFDIGRVQINPRTRRCRISTGLARLCKTGNDTKRHLGVCRSIAAVQNRLIKCKTDRLTDSNQKLISKVKIGIL